MVHISLPENKERRLVFYLAMEEYVAAHLSSLLAGRTGKTHFSSGRSSRLSFSDGIR